MNFLLTTYLDVVLLCCVSWLWIKINSKGYNNTNIGNLFDMRERERERGLCIQWCSMLSSIECGAPVIHPKIHCLQVNCYFSFSWYIVYCVLHLTTCRFSVPFCVCMWYFKYFLSSGVHIVCFVIFKESALGRFFHRVAMSVYLSLCLSVCPLFM